MNRGPRYNITTYKPMGFHNIDTKKDTDNIIIAYPNIKL